MSEYDFEIHHIPGKLNGQADALSRRPDYDQGEDDNVGVTVLPDKVFARAMTMIQAPLLRHVIPCSEMELMDPIYAQKEELLKPWVNAHHLKKIKGIWYKVGR